MPWIRVAIAFIVAPAIGVLAASLAALALAPIPIGFVLSMLVVAYLITAVIGVPAFLLSRSWALTSLWSCAVAGLFMASITAVPLWYLLNSWAVGLIVLSMIIGVTAGLTFGLVLGPKSNNRWRGP